MNVNYHVTLIEKGLKICIGHTNTGCSSVHLIFDDHYNSAQHFLLPYCHVWSYKFKCLSLNLKSNQIGWFNILQSQLLQNKQVSALQFWFPEKQCHLIGSHWHRYILLTFVWFWPLECHTRSSPEFPCRTHVFKQESASPRPMLAHGDSNAWAERVVCVASECCNQMVSWKHVVPNHPPRRTRFLWGID